MESSPQGEKNGPLSQEEHTETITTRRTINHKRKGWQFTIRHLLAAVTAIAGVTAWESPYLQRGQHHAHVEREVSKLGGRASTNEIFEGPHFTNVSRLGADRIAYIEFPHRWDTDPLVTDSDLKKVELQTIDTLEVVDFRNNPGVGDETLASLIGNTNIRLLNLSGTGVTDAGVRHLPALRNLKVLYLDCTNVTDKSMPTIAGLPSLIELHITRTRVTGEGLKALYGSPIGALYISRPMENCDFLEWGNEKRDAVLRRHFPGVIVVVIDKQERG